MTTVGTEIGNSVLVIGYD